MKRPDWGNQRTGQPRCAQLIAKTWNRSPATRRTQHAVSTVFPSVGITNGLRKVAIRVSPSGKLVTSPRRTHDRYPFPRPRDIDKRRKPTIGTATTIAANALNRIPSFIKKPRREIALSVDGAIT